MNSMAAFLLGLFVGLVFGWLTLGLCVAASRAYEADEDEEEEWEDE